MWCGRRRQPPEAHTLNTLFREGLKGEIAKALAELQYVVGRQNLWHSRILTVSIDAVNKKIPGGAAMSARRGV